MEKIPKREKHDVELDFYVHLNMWVNQRLMRIDPDLTARVVSVDKEPGLKDAKTVTDSERNVILVSSKSDPSMEWSVAISKDFSKQEEKLNIFEKDYFGYKNETESI